MSKEKEVMLYILEMYKDMPYLWDKNDPNYMNKIVRNEAFQVLLNLYKKVDETATTKTLKKKIDNLKTNYYKEVKKIKESKLSGAGDEDVYVPTIWYYDSLCFLESTTESCRSVKETIENGDSSLSCSEDTQSATKDSTFKRKKKGAPLKLQHDILEKSSNLMYAKEEDWEILGKSIGMQLRDLNRPQHTIARKLISDVIYYGALNKLSEESFVGLDLPKASYIPCVSSQTSSQSEFNPPVDTSSPQHLQSQPLYPLQPNVQYIIKGSQPALSLSSREKAPSPSSVGNN